MKTKTIHQQLQSRISVRRNYIRYMEQQVAIAFDRKHPDRFEAKHILQSLRSDQMLDKKLFAMVLQGEANQRFYAAIRGCE